MNNTINRYQERLTLDRIARKEAIARFEETQKTSKKTPFWKMLLQAAAYASVVFIMAYSVAGPTN
jgi:hypothetical protein